MRKAKIRKLLNLKKDSMTLQEYNLKFSQLAYYAPDMVVGMRNRMSLYVFGLGCSTNNERKGFMLIIDMYIG